MSRRIDRVARSEQVTPPRGSGTALRDERVLLVDLNIFANFPTLAIGILAASLRNAGIDTEVLSPLAFDAPAAERERQETLADHLMRRVHLADLPGTAGIRDLARRARAGHLERPGTVVMREVTRALARGPRIVLLSAYLQQFATVRAIAAAAKARGIFVLLGGPMFNRGEVADQWRRIDGVGAVVGAEMDRDIGPLVRAILSGANLLDFPGVVLPDGSRSQAAPPLRPLEDVPIPDFRDFPWDRYPARIVPVMTGRGCQWDSCTFCSDIISVSGRTFRTRSVESVLLEMQEQARRHATSNFLFLDLKLNSWPGMIRGIAGSLGKYVQGAEWVGTVHVDQRPDNGLSRADLELAVEGGMRRVSFGLESGSQRMLDAMRKGCTVERNGRFLIDAHEAGLSVRCTMFKGYPSETATDMEATADFLEAHAHAIDRIRFNDFTLTPGTAIWDAVTRSDPDAATLQVRRIDQRRGRSLYERHGDRSKAYRRAKARALRIVYQINRQPLRDAARQFDGLM